VGEGVTSNSFEGGDAPLQKGTAFSDASSTSSPAKNQSALPILDPFPWPTTVMAHDRRFFMI